MILRAAIAWLFLASWVAAQGEIHPFSESVNSGPRVEVTETPVWAAQVALADAKTLPADVASRSRYVWLRGGSRDELAALSFVINSTLSRVNVGILPGTSAGAVPFAGGRLVRLDFGLLATDADDFANLAATWEKLSAVDTDFGATITQRRKIDTTPYTLNGRRYTKKFVWDRVRFQSPPDAVELSAVLGGTTAPIVDGRLLLRTALTTLEGGQYYRFRGLALGMKIKDYLRSRGASQEQVEALESLEKAVVLHSLVTGKERMVSVFRGAGVRASRGGGIVAITLDQFDEQRDPNASPIRNLIGFDGDGFEVIIELANGFHEWTLWNAAGELVAVAPPNLVSDHRIPEPYTKQLQPGISCIRCHAGEDGWRGITNDVPKILAGGTDLFGDLSGADQAKQVQLLAGLYSGDWFAAGIGPLAVGRLTYDRACFEVTGRPVDEMAGIVAALYGAYEYDLLDVWAVGRELGVTGLPPSDGDPATEEDSRAACAALRELIGAQPVEGGAGREDAVIASVLAGIPVSRRSWQSAAHIAMERCYQRGIQ